MARAAVGQFDQFFMILAGNFLMALQTEAHIKYLRVLSDGYLGHIAMAILAVLSRGHMGAVIKLNKIRYLSHRHPFEGRAAEYVFL